MIVPKNIVDSLKAARQEHLIQFWDELDENEQHMLLEDLRSLDFAAMNQLYSNAMDSLSTDVAKLDNKMQVIPSTQFESKLRATNAQIDSYFRVGLKEIALGKVAVVLMAGGQGTRLGVTYPKGMYSVGLLSEKTLFQLQAERIQKVEQLAADAFPSEKRRHVTWYIMTSGPTEAATKSFLLDHNYFGLRKENIVIFEQGLLPSFDFQGKIILDEKHRLSMSPDGNGGIYKALAKNGILEDMDKRGVEFVHCHSVDNILVKVADPLFIGYCVEKGADCGAKVVQKASPTEAVGVVCLVEGKFQVVEYSEITSATANRRNDADGALTFDAANICNHYFTREFLHRIAKDFETDLKLHVAKKKIAYVNENGDRIVPKDVTGVKVEKFVFDVFMYSDQFVTWQVPREEDFSPVKNSDDAGRDCPATARRDLYRLHRTLLQAAGGKVDPLAGETAELSVEISPLVSYGGEGLEALVRGRTFKSPVVISAPSEGYGVGYTNGNS